jgi:hypothetical protein
MKRLNGWQRIGIIASVVWMIGGTIWIEKNRLDRAEATGNFVWNTCLNALDHDTTANADIHVWEKGNDACAHRGTEATADAGGFTSKLSESAGGAALALGIAWLFVYGLVGLVRWVGAGFKQTSHN